MHTQAQAESQFINTVGARRLRPLSMTLLALALVAILSPQKMLAAFLNPPCSPFPNPAEPEPKSY